MARRENKYLGNLSIFHNRSCYYCERTMYYYKVRGVSQEDLPWLKPTRDHVIPKSVAKHVKNNIVICCRWCNHVKSNLPLEVFTAWLVERKRR